MEWIKNNKSIIFLALLTVLLITLSTMLYSSYEKRIETYEKTISSEKVLNKELYLTLENYKKEVVELSSKVKTLEEDKITIKRKFDAVSGKLVSEQIRASSRKQLEEQIVQKQEKEEQESSVLVNKEMQVNTEIFVEKKEKKVVKKKRTWWQWALFGLGIGLLI